MSALSEAELAAIDAQLENLRRIGGDRFVGEMIGLFLENAPKWLAAAGGGARAGDWAAVGKAVHPLRSSAGNFGATALQELCAEIERNIRQGQVEQVPELARQMEESFAPLRRHLEARKGVKP